MEHFKIISNVLFYLFLGINLQHVSGTQSSVLLPNSTTAATTESTMKSTLNSTIELKIISPTMKPVCTPRCPNPGPSCRRDELAYDGNGNLNNPGSQGKWRIFNNSLYLFVFAPTNKENAETLCCKYNMNLLSVNTEGELGFVGDFLSKLPAFNEKISFWTSGMSDGCADNFYWCPSNKNLMTGLKWDPNVPKTFNGQYVLVASDELTKGKRNVFLKPANWVGELSAVACEGPTTTTVVPTVACKPECPSHQCTADMTRFLADGKTIKDPARYGQWQKQCGSTFLLTNFTVNWLEGIKLCCKLGMKLLTLESKAKIKCATNVARMMMSKDTLVWVYATNLECIKTFMWCGTGITFSSVERNPAGLSTDVDNRLGDDNTFIISLEYDSFYRNNVIKAYDETLYAKRSVICEGPPNMVPNSVTTEICTNKPCKNQN